MSHMTIAPPPVEDREMQMFGPSRGLLDVGLADVWHYRELLYYLTWRDIKIRYKQTFLGVGWAILQPVLTMIVFTVIFSYFAKLPSDDLPYPIFTYTALLPWSLFAGAVTRSGTSLVDNTHLVTKVYFPRLILPIASTLAPLIDFLLAFGVLLGMMVWYRMAPTVGIVMLPVFTLLALLIALAVSLWLAALNVRYRDVKHLIPFLMQFWMYASPVAYAASIVPERWRLLYGLNPMSGVIEGFRWALLGKASPDFALMTVSTVVVMVLLAGGLIYFRRMELSFADVI